MNRPTRVDTRVGTALVRRPGPRLEAGLVTHISRRSIDVQLAEKQWEGYVSALSSAGWAVVEVPGLDTAPDAVFVEDAVVVANDLAVVTRPGAQSRRAEVHAVADICRDLGLRVRSIEAPGTLDGGDVLKVGSQVFVGQGGRSNGAGLDQLADLLGGEGFEVIGVPVERVLHLKSAVTALPDGTVIGFAPLVDEPDVFERFLPVPEEAGAHVVILGPSTILMADRCPRSAQLLRRRGYEVIEVAISEFEKLEGCVTCLSVRVRAFVAGRGQGLVSV